MKFKSLTLNAWKQFESIKIDFHPSVTILTGANGSGKTTILGILSRHFGWGKVELSVPILDKITETFKWFSRFFEPNDQSRKIGELTYDTGKTDLRIPKQEGPIYHIEMPSLQNFPGVNIPSHRQVYSYQQVPHISTQKRTKVDAYNLVMQSAIQKSQNGHGQPTNFYIKETLLNWAIGGAGNEFIVADAELYKNFKEFEYILGKVLPDSLGFKKISIRSYEIVLETNSGDFMLDALSGGLSAIIDLAWQIYNCQRDKDGGLVVLIDEIENHLHPSMQRRILPDLAKAFPKIQFVVSTHSPLVVGSTKESKVFAFVYNSNGKVISEELDLVNKAKSATQILNDVLGVPVTLPIWAEEELNRILSNWEKNGDPGKQIQKLKSDLTSAGLENYFPDAILKLSKVWE